MIWTVHWVCVRLVRPPVGVTGRPHSDVRRQYDTFHWSSSGIELECSPSIVITRHHQLLIQSDSNVFLHSQVQSAQSVAFNIQNLASRKPTNCWGSTAKSNALFRVPKLPVKRLDTPYGWMSFLEFSWLLTSQFLSEGNIGIVLETIKM